MELVEAANDTRCRGEHVTWPRRVNVDFFKKIRRGKVHVSPRRIVFPGKFAAARHITRRGQIVPESYFYSFPIKKLENEIIYPKPNIQTSKTYQLHPKQSIYPKTSKR